MMDFTLSKTKKKKLSKEVAHDQVMVLLDYYGIDVNDLDGKQNKQAMVSTLNKVVGFVREGLVEIALKDGALTITQALVKPPGEVKTIEYGEVHGKHKTAMDGKGDDSNYTKIYALMGSLSGLGDTAIKALKGKDLSVVECLGTVFLAV
jgi:hypothetical protein